EDLAHLILACRALQCQAPSCCADIIALGCIAHHGSGRTNGSPRRLRRYEMTRAGAFSLRLRVEKWSWRGSSLKHSPALYRFGPIPSNVTSSEPSRTQTTSGPGCRCFPPWNDGGNQSSRTVRATSDPVYEPISFVRSNFSRGPVR